MTLSYEIPPHFITEIRPKGHDAIGVNTFHRTIIRFIRKKEDQNIPTILLMRRFCFTIHVDRTGSSHFEIAVRLSNRP